MTKQQQVEHRSVAVKSLKANPMQPPMRTSDKAVVELRDCISQTGFIATIVGVQVDDDIVVVDGHRRKFLANELGRTHMAVDVLPSGDPIQLFMLMNRGMLSLNGKHSFQGWAHCTRAQQQRIMKQMKSGVRGDIQWLIDSLGYDWTMALGMAGRVSPHVAAQIKTITTHIATYRIPNPPTVLDVAEWVLDLGLQRYVREQEKQDFANKKKFETVCSWIRKGEAPVSMRHNIGMDERVAALRAHRRSSRLAARAAARKRA